jgi:hypothetical protein
MRLLYGCLVSAIALLAPPAIAQTSGTRAPRPLAESLHGPAKEAYTSARFLYQRGDFTGAEAKYRQAYDLSKDARLVFNMAACEKELHHYARMQSLLVRYENEATPEMLAEDKSGVDSALAALKNLVGTVTITANVAGAEVMVDEEPAGTTPLAGPVVLDLGRHKITLRKAGFDAVTDAIDVQGGSAMTEAVTLVEHAHDARLLIIADDDATIAIDGKPTAKERFDGPVPAGSHDLQVTAPGKVAYRSEVELHEGESRTLQVTLAKETPHGAVWPWIVGGAVAAVGLGVGAYLLLRPQDQTAPVPAGPLGNYGLNAWRAW